MVALQHEIDECRIDDTDDLICALCSRAPGDWVLVVTADFIAKIQGWVDGVGKPALRDGTIFGKRFELKSGVA